eukprot:TRINITY_DN20643_c0_g1_i1.p1 TRINITY_DN20643_c0_g1~~TRINITY_DN20643_c0_g1_i1.p1  ORF type:complete len:251 (-),score=4.52 TRINITY_DN20643_c0_g1_i1:295-1047(-)
MVCCMGLLKETMRENGDPHDSETDEAISLSDLPSGEAIQDLPKESDNRASPDHQLFEFTNNFNAEMCAAEDIFLYGKLLPFKSALSDQITSTRNEKTSFLRARSESLGELRSGRGRLMRSSLDGDYRRLHSVPSSSKASQTVSDRAPGGTCFRNCKFSLRKENHSGPATPKWRLFVFGLVKGPSEMAMKEIRHRQSRRNPAPLFPVFNGGETVSVRRGDDKGPWRLLRSLSCTRNANAVVTASFPCMSRA